MIKSSIAFKLISKLDINESSLLETVNNSFLANKFSNLFSLLQLKLSELTRSSKIIKNIDYLILTVLSLAIISILFAPTGIIGLFVLVSFLLLLLKFFCVKDEKYGLNSFDIPVFLYIAIAGLSVAFSSLFLPSLKGYIKMLVYFGGYLTFLNILKNHPKRIIYLLGLLTITASIEAFYAIYQQITGVEALASWQDQNEVNPEQLMNRVYGTLKPFNPNLLAGYLVASFSSALGMSFWFLNKKKYKVSIAAFIGTAAILVGILFTGSRGAYVASAAMIGLFVLISGHIIYHEYGHIKWLKKLWITCIVVGILGVITLIIISPALQHRVLSIFALRTDSSNSYRLNVYASSFKIFHDNWLTGIGTGNTTFRLIYGLYMVTGFDALGAYCVPLEVAVETGIFGLIAFVWILSLSYIKSIKYIIKKNLLENKIIAASCLIGITGMMVHGFVDTIWFRPQVNIIFWMLIAVLAIITSKYYNFTQTEKHD